MSFASGVPEETPQSLWSELQENNSRLLLTIPFGCEPEKMIGFVAVTGDVSCLPLLTICIEKPSKDRCIVTNIVFPSKEIYQEFVDKLYIDSKMNFSQGYLLEN